MPRKRCLVTLGTAVLLIAPSLILAFSPLDPDEAASATPIRVALELNVHPSLIRYEQGARDAWDLPGTREFFSKYSSDWDVTWDTRSDLPHMISGRGIPMVPGNGNDLEWNYEPSLAQVEGLVRAFMDDNKALFGLPQSDLILRQAGSGNFGRNNQLWFIELQQHYNGIPVEGAVVFFRINNGNLIQFGNDMVAPFSLNTRASLSSSEALTMSLEILGRDSNQLTEVLSEGALKILPTLLQGELPGNSFDGVRGAGYNHILVRESVFRVAGDDSTYQVLVDVNKGEVINVADLNRTTDVQGGIYPTGPLDAEVTRLFQQVTVSGGCTQLNGVYTRINDNCGSINVCDADDGSADNVIDLGMSGGTDCTTPGYGGAGNTHSARTGHYNLTNINRTAATYYPSNSWLASKLTANMNINNTCNAYWSGSTVNFYRSGGGCGNTGEIAAVFLHEWGHGMDTNTGGGSDKGTGETVGDAFAVVTLHTPCIGAGFRSTPCYNCSTCTGVRDWADFSHHDGTATIASPSTVGSNSGINCDRYSCPYYTSLGQAYQGVMGYEGHCESYISSSAMWDLIVELRNAHGDATGWDTIEQIWYDSLTPSKKAYRITSGGQCNPSASIDGCASTNYYTVFLSVDDDDGNLSNGTPNGCRIWDAFDYHDIACGTRPACSGGCSTDPEFDGAQSAAQVPSTSTIRLEWDAATPICSTGVSYNVYRSTSAGFTPSSWNRIATCVNGLSYDDTGLSADTYYYKVRAEDGASGGGGPCNDGNEDANLVEVSASVGGRKGRLTAATPVSSRP